MQDSGQLLTEQLDPNTLRLARAIEPLPARDGADLQAVADAFAESAPWDGELEPRKTR